MQELQQEARAAVGSSHSSTSWVPMSAHAEELVTCSTNSTSSSRPCGQNALRTYAGVQDSYAGAACPSTGVSSWISPAAAVMQLLQQMPLNAASPAIAQSAQRQQQPQGTEPSDDILIAAACGAAADGSTIRIMPGQQEPGAVPTLPMLQQVVPRMQLASAGTALGRPLLLKSSSAGAPFGNCHTAGDTSTARQHSHSRAAGQAGAAGRQSEHAVQQAGSAQRHAVSAAAAEAEAAIKAAAAVRPWVASLMQLSSAQPGCGSGTLLGQPGAGSVRACAVGKKAPVDWQHRDTTQGRDVLSVLQEQQRANGCTGASAAASESSSSKTRQELEAQLVPIACLALQGVWSAVEQLWQLVLQGTQVEEDPHSKR